MDIKGFFTGAVKTAFPAIAAALQYGGPLGAVAAKALSDKLGVEVKPEDVEKKISEQAMTAEGMAMLKQLDNEIQIRMAELGIDLEKIAADDRANARAREIEVKDRIPGYLAIAVTGGFFGLLAILAYHPVPMEAHDILLAMIGSLGTAWIAVVNYYFGSSAGSAAKTRIMAEQSGK